MAEMGGRGGLAGAAAADAAMNTSMVQVRAEFMGDSGKG